MILIPEPRFCEFEVILDYIQRKEKEEVVKEEKGERKEGRGRGGDEKGGRNRRGREEEKEGE